jgi:hypothetical protein
MKFVIFSQPEVALSGSNKVIFGYINYQFSMSLPGGKKIWH